MSGRPAESTATAKLEVMATISSRPSPSRSPAAKSWTTVGSATLNRRLPSLRKAKSWLPVPARFWVPTITVGVSPGSIRATTGEVGTGPMPRDQPGTVVPSP